MAATTLGKRTRSAFLEDNTPSTRSQRAAATSAAPITRSTRSKRKAEFVIAADENENPFVSRKTRKVAQNGDDMVVDELALKNTPAAKKADTVRTTPAKHGTAGRRIALSPKKNDIAQENVQEEFSSKPPTPSTPRHRDALSKKVPITPRHRVGLIGKTATPQTPKTPSTPHHTGPSVYNLARQVFARGAASDRLVGRDTERQELRDFIRPRLEKANSGCAYVSGPPGTGKSALVNEICDEMQESMTFQRSYVNCMSVKSAKDLSAKLLEDFDEMDVLEGAEEKALHGLFSKKSCAHLVILDEVDHLLDVDIELLYQVFEWSMQSSSNLTVIGIANALDFTDRFLPRLKSRGLKPQLLPFMPYSVAQIASILTSKLKALLPENTTATADFVPFLHPTAIQFASKKVAAQTGDLRKAFAISARALDLIETETRASLSKTTAEITPSPTPSPAKTPLMENMNLSSPAMARSPSKAQRPQNPLANLTIETAPRATIAHMARVTAAVFSNGSSQRLTSLNLQQKAIMVSVLVLEKRLRERHEMDVLATPSRANGAPTIKALHAAYTELCKTDNILHALTATEFRDVLASLETLSLISWVNGRSGTFTATAPGTPSRRGRQGGFGMKVAEEKRVASSVGVKELKESLKGPASDILLNMLGSEGL
jgi:cell division control protein 6